MILPTNRFVVQFLARITEDDNGCWLWNGVIDKIGGYPRWYMPDYVDDWAHRNAYRLAGGTIPDGWHVDHICHNQDSTCPGGNRCRHRRCVNPTHLEVVSPLVNARRRDARRADLLKAATA